MIIDMTGTKYGKLSVIERYFNTNTKDTRAYWKCICECGKTVCVSGKNLRSGNTKSCGCYKPKTTEKGFTALNTYYYQYKHGAKRRSITFNLSIEQFKIIISNNCFYCDIVPTERYVSTKLNGSIYCNGIDRMQNNIGYEIDNCVACCWVCNNFKGSRNTSEFIHLCKLIGDRF